MSLPRHPSARTSAWRRPRWRDPRLAAGAVLIAGSVALGAWAVDAAARTEQVYLLTRDVAPGASLEAQGVLAVVGAQPGTGAYLRVGELPSGAVATRAMGKGELVPRAAVDDAGPAGMRSLVLDIASGLPAGTGVGDVVDLWSLPSTRTAAQDPDAGAEEVATGLTVAAVGEAGQSLVGASTVSVELLVPEASLSDVLTAVGAQGSLVLVPTSEAA